MLVLVVHLLSDLCFVSCFVKYVFMNNFCVFITYVDLYLNIIGYL